MDETLVLLWFTSLVMAVLAIFWLASLIVARVVRAHRDARRDRDRDAVRAACLAILAQGPDAADALVPLRHRARLFAEVLLDFVSIVRGSEFSELIEACDRAGIDHEMRHRLFKGSRQGRLASVEALGLFPGYDTIAAVEQVLDRVHDEEMRLGALRTLVELGAPPPLEQLVREFSSTRIASRDQVLITRRMIERRPEEALVLLDEGGLPARARILLADGLGAAGDYRAIEPLGQLSTDENASVRAEAVRSLGMLSHPVSVPDLVRALGDSEWEVRAAACEAAGRIGGPEFLPPLGLCLGDPVWWVRFQAAEALMRLGPAGVAALELAANGAEGLPRRVAAVALAERGVVNLVPMEAVA